MNRGKYKHIFFDLDRTLWDFETNARITFRELYEKYQLKTKGINQFEEFYSKYTYINEGLWDKYRRGVLTKEVLRDLRFAQTLNEFGIKDYQLAEELGKDYVAISPTKSKMMAGALDIVQYLANKNYPMHIITNGFEEVQIIKMKFTGLDQYFDKLITSERAGVKKPDAGIFHLAFKESGASPETSIMIGDDYKTDIIGAQSVGMDQVFYDPNSEKSLDMKTTYYTKDLLDLKKWL